MNSAVASLSTAVSSIDSTGTKYFHANSTEADSVASGKNSIAIGPNAVSSGENAVAMGNGALASGDGSLALGSQAQAKGNDSVALGNGAKVTADNSVALGAGAVADGSRLQEPAYNPGGNAVEGLKPVGEVSVGAAGSERRISHVAAGSAGRDMINISQLKAIKGELDGAVDKLSSDVAAGSASASAAATIPQSIYPGKGLFGVAVGTFNGSSALAVGVSKVSDNGKWIYKANVTADTSKKVGAAVGGGFEW